MSKVVLESEIWMIRGKRRKVHTRIWGFLRVGGVMDEPSIRFQDKACVVLRRKWNSGTPETQRQAAGTEEEGRRGDVRKRATCSPKTGRRRRDAEETEKTG